jgi:hypothetical protein
MTRLIFIEGVSGAGKSTSAKALAERLRDVKHYAEGDISNPVDFYAAAYFSAEDYDNFLSEYAQFADKIRKRTVAADDVRLVRYMDGKTPLFSAPLSSALRRREFCWNPGECVPFAEYRRVMETLWCGFAQRADLPDYVVFDGSLLHHTVNDMRHNYGASVREIAAHIGTLLDAVSALNPTVFYLRPESIRASLINARTSRRERAATEEDVAFWDERGRVDTAVLAELRADVYVLDVAIGGWGEVVERMMNELILKMETMNN